jgi:hypothetical protein
MARVSSKSTVAEDFSQVFPDPPALSSKGRRWKNVTVMRLDQTVDEVAVPALSNHAVFMSVGERYRMEEKLDERLYRTYIKRPRRRPQLKLRQLTLTSSRL